VITYSTLEGSERYRIFTGSLNLSANGVSNKEVFFEIDTQDARWPTILKEQDDAMMQAGELEVLSQAALFNRLMGSAFTCGYRRPVDHETKSAFRDFLENLGLSQWDSVSLLNRRLLAPKDRFLDSVSQFYRSSRHHSSGPCVVQELNNHLKDLPRWKARPDSAELLLTLVDDKSTMKPHTEQAILKSLGQAF
jgi:hypothetical protein